MHVTLVCPTDITGRVMFVDVEEFLRGVQTLSSFIVYSAELFPVVTAEFFVKGDYLTPGWQGDGKF